MSRATFIHSIIEGRQHRTRKDGARRMASQRHAQMSLSHIIRVTAAKHGLTYDDLIGKRRTADVCKARHEAVLRAHEEGRFSLTQIGCAFGGRDHTTILNSINRAREARDG